MGLNVLIPDNFLGKERDFFTSYWCSKKKSGCQKEIIGHQNIQSC